MKIKMTDVIRVKVQGKTHWDEEVSGPYKAIRVTLWLKCKHVAGEDVVSTKVELTTRCMWGSCAKSDVSDAAARIVCDTFGWNHYKFTMSKPWKECVLTVKGYSDVDDCEFK